ncbi:adenylyltransferase/cytidyltransferase family protein [Candidatus Woesearchaeota archaeon]|nr:adenylyltransferase/cytidyltransferase family protein [Candidatus Woesearchaeota archaeon]
MKSKTDTTNIHVKTNTSVKTNTKNTSIGKKVMCFGTFDILHLGHVNYFEQAKQRGEHLTVVIARDETKQKQQKNILFSEQERLQLIQSLKVVDEAVLGNAENHFKIIVEKKPDIVCLGYDQAISELVVEEKLRSLGLKAKVLRMQPYQEERQKSTRLRNELEVVSEERSK